MLVSVLKLPGDFRTQAGSLMNPIFRSRSVQLATAFLALVPLPCAAGTVQTPVGAKASQPVTVSQAQATSQWQSAKSAGDAAVLRGSLPDAEEKYHAALSAAEKSKDNKGIVSCLTSLANCLAAQPNRISDEEPLRQRAADLAEKTIGATSPQFAGTLAGLADMQARKGESGLAEENTDRATKILGESDEKYPLEMATCYQAIGQRQVAIHTLGLADDSFKKALDLRSAKLPANDILVLETCRCYADLLKQLDRNDEAKKLQDRIVLARAEAPAGNISVASGATTSSTSTESAKSAKTDESKPILAKLVNEAKDASKAGDPAKAVTSWKAVVEAAEKSGAKDGRLPYALVHLGDAYHAQGSNEEAAVLYKRAIDMGEQQGAAKALGMVRSVSRLASIELQKKNSAEASRLYIRALALEDDQNAPDVIVAGTLSKMIAACMMAQDNAHVEVAAKRLIALADKIGGPAAEMQKRTAVAMLGSVYIKSGHMSEGVQLMKSMSHMPKTNPADFANAAKESLAAEDAIYDKSEEATFLN